MKEYIYPAIFTKEEDGLYSVVFKDLESCYTCGDNIEDAILNARDVLSIVLYRYEKEGKDIPKASEIKNIKLDKNSFSSFIVGDVESYRRIHSNKSIKKTLSIPEWLNELAIAKNINFSKVLQDALIKIIGNENKI